MGKVTAAGVRAGAPAADTRHLHGLTRLERRGEERGGERKYPPWGGAREREASTRTRV